MPDFTFDQLNLVKTNSKDDLQLSDQEQSYPVILFSHGAGTTMEVQTSQSEDLASHGYIVVAVDHTYVSAATVFPDRIVSANEATTDFTTAEPAEIITQIMADDAKFVIEKLSEMNEGKVEGSDHMKFTDIGLFIGSRRLRELINIGGKTDPARCLGITEAMSLLTPQIASAACSPVVKEVP